MKDMTELLGEQSRRSIQVQLWESEVEDCDDDDTSLASSPAAVGAEHLDEDEKQPESLREQKAGRTAAGSHQQQSCLDLQD